MGVYIKGMQMPKTCGECKFFAWKRGVGQYCAINDEITFHATLDDFDVDYKRNGTCPLIFIPPHVRLGDLDELLDRAFGCLDEETFIAFQFLANGSVTIIPAEEDE